MAEHATLNLGVPADLTEDMFGSALESMVEVLNVVDAAIPMGALLISEMDALADAGVMNSLKYRMALTEEFLKDKTSGEQAAFFFLCIMTGAVKVVDRMKNACRRIKNAQLRGQCLNILGRMAKYNAQKSGALKFSGHNMASAFPELSVIGKAMITEPQPNIMIPNYQHFAEEEKRDTDARETTTDRASVHPVFSCMQTGQLFLSEASQLLHMKWEKHFWLDVVNSGSNRFTNSWNPRFYQNKVGDRYMIPHIFGVDPPATPYTPGDLQAWHENLYRATHQRATR